MRNISQHNNAAMKTVVETFLIEETAELIYDNEKLDQWNQHVEALGLKGQKQIVRKDKSPIPFMHMNAATVAIFETLCPRKVDVEDYDVTPIPVEILDLVAMSKNEGHFTKVQIWYDDKTPDPACVGLGGYYYELGWYDDSNKALKDERFKTKEECVAAGAKHPSYTIGNHYLLGRWADVKQTLEELKDRAVKRFIGAQKAEIEQRIRDEKRKLEDLSTTAYTRFGGGATDDLPF